MRDFVNSRVVGGVQQIKTNIDFHTYSELVLWPYGYTTADTAPGLNADEQRARSRRSGTSMARDQRLHARAGVRPLHHRRLDRRLAVGRATGSSRYTFEMYPRGSSPGFYPPDEVIAARDEPATARPSLLLLEYSDCPHADHRQAGAVLRRPGAGDALQRRLRDGEDVHVRRHGHDRAASRSATPPRRRPAAPSSSARPTSGARDLVTGRLAGADAGDQRHRRRHDLSGVAGDRAAPAARATTLDVQLVPRPRLQRHRRPTTCACLVNGDDHGCSSSSARRATATAPGRPRPSTSTRSPARRSGFGSKRPTPATASLVEAAVDDLKVTRT